MNSYILVLKVPKPKTLTSIFFFIRLLKMDIVMQHMEIFSSKNNLILQLYKMTDMITA